MLEKFLIKNYNFKKISILKQNRKMSNLSFTKYDQSKLKIIGIFNTKKFIYNYLFKFL